MVHQEGIPLTSNSPERAEVDSDANCAASCSVATVSSQDRHADTADRAYDEICLLAEVKAHSQGLLYELINANGAADGWEPRDWRSVFERMVCGQNLQHRLRPFNRQQL